MESYSDLIPYILIPFITGIVGWFTNFVGIKMILYPTNWTGIGNFIGWQGIVPKLRVKLARQLVRNSISVICTQRELLEAVEECGAIEYISDVISPQAEEWVDDIMQEHGPLYWELLPKTMRNMVYNHIRQQLPKLSHEILVDLRKSADRFIDMEDIAGRQAFEKPEILTYLIDNMAKHELKFIIMSGLYLGFPLGIVQALSWYFFPNIWVLPMFGVFVGACTNWIALQIVVKPYSPVNILGFKFQGIFIKRQRAVSKEFAEIFTNQFLDVKSLFDYIWYGDHSDEVYRIVRRRIRISMEKNRVTGAFDKIMRISGQKIEFDAKTISVLENRLVSTLDQPVISRKLLAPINELIATRLSNLSPKQFQGLLMPIFESEQWIVILVGGILGGAVGTAQLVYLFGESLF